VEAGTACAPDSSDAGVMGWLKGPVLAASGVSCVRMSPPASSTLLGYLDETNISLSAGNVSFMEMDYSCNSTFVVGVYVVQDGSSTKFPVLFLTPNQSTGVELPQWNKIYMDLGVISSPYPSADGFRLYFECTREEATVPVIFIDDIKIVK